jgi:hypothetical protein
MDWIGRWTTDLRNNSRQRRRIFLSAILVIVIAVVLATAFLVILILLLSRVNLSDRLARSRPYCRWSDTGTGGCRRPRGAAGQRHIDRYT